ncbi:MAG: DUF2911 domain-containing protein [Gemmatimonadota bacterium]
MRFGILTLLLGLTPAVAGAQVAVSVNMRDVADGWRHFNRTPAVVSESGRSLLRFDERPGGGLAWNPAMQFQDGELEVDLKGRDVLQKSFLGIAFHIAADTSFEVVWLRPFNFQSTDSARRAHAVQYADYPDFGWDALRKQHPGAFEAAVPSDLGAESWVHLRVAIHGRQVTAYLNRNPSPVLSITMPGNRTRGGVGLFVGDQSPGDFANFVVRPSRSASVTSDAPERYGFVATLGRDTVSVEKVVRTGSRLVSDQVERFPQVVSRHTVIDLAPDGSVRHLESDIRLPNARTPKWRERHVVADDGRDSVRISIRNGEGTRRVAVEKGGMLTMPWSGQQYSLSELYFAAAARLPGDSVTLRIYYLDAQAEEYPFLLKVRPAGTVRKFPGGRMEVSHHDALSGTGEAMMDARERMLSYSGARTTFKMKVERLANTPDVETTGAVWAAAEKVAGTPSEMSVRDTVRGSIGAASFQIDYGRPTARGRVLVGDVIPLDQVWRTGANAATQFTTSSAISLAGLELAPGTYTLWTLPTASGVQLIVNKQFKQWGTQYDSTRDLGRAPLAVASTDASTERFTLSVEPADSTHGTLVLMWGKFRWTAPIAVR